MRVKNSSLFQNPIVQTIPESFSNSRHKMENLKIYEDFDLDKFMEDPYGNIHDDDSPEIEEGDYITSYRGIGQVLEIGDPFLRVQLINPSKSIVKIPKENVSKIKKEEAELAIKRIPKTSEDIERIGNDIEYYLEKIGAYDSDDIHLNNPDSALEFLENVLVDAIGIVKKDPYATYHKEYSTLIFGFSTIEDAILNSTEDPRILNRLRKIKEDFLKISE
jgi:hypothetical protein